MFDPSDHQTNVHAIAQNIQSIWPTFDDLSGEQMARIAQKVEASFPDYRIILGLDSNATPIIYVLFTGGHAFVELDRSSPVLDS